MSEDGDTDDQGEPPSQPSSRRVAGKSIRRWLLALGSLAFSLLLVEVVCRWCFPASPSIRFQQDVDELEGLALEEAVDMIRNDAELFWSLAPNKTLPDESWPFFGVISNGQSLREGVDIPLRKPDGELRILFLGDSCTFGYGVDHRETFVEVAESLLREQRKQPVECINAGVPGYSIFQGFRYLETKGLAFDPDLVVLNFGWNDSGVWDHMGDREHGEVLKRMRPPGLLARSRLCQIAWETANRPDQPKNQEEKRPRMRPGEFAETLEQIHGLLRERNIPVLVLVWPMRANFDPGVPAEARTVYQVKMAEFGETNPMSKGPAVAGSIDLIPVAGTLVEKYGLQATYLDHGHVTPLAHKAIGGAIVAHLEPWLPTAGKQGH